MATPIDRTELIRLIDGEGVQIVDVLPEAEFVDSHIPGAISIPLRRLTAKTVSMLHKDKPVVVYCHDGL
jgi:rhodanese-related sulfurtransferase